MRLWRIRRWLMDWRHDFRASRGTVRWSAETWRRLACHVEDWRRLDGSQP